MIPSNCRVMHYVLAGAVAIHWLRSSWFLTVRSWSSVCSQKLELLAVQVLALG